MAISSEWQKFIAEYGADGAYWYFPKGGTADKDEFREQFRVFDLFEGEVFTPELQARIGAELRSEGLTTAGDDFPRQIKRVFENMGLCWIEEDRPIRVTPAGRLYLEEPSRPQQGVGPTGLALPDAKPRECQRHHGRDRASPPCILCRNPTEVRWRDQR